MNNIETLKREFDYYVAHKEDFIRKYNGKCVAIKEHKVVYSDESKESVIKFMIKNNHELGTFLVQYITDGEETVQRYYSRVYVE